MTFNPASVDILSLPSVALEDRRGLPRASGIYFAYQPHKVLYIGQAADMHKRWKSTNHHRYIQLSEMLDVRLAWLSVEIFFLNTIEIACIEYFRPELNASDYPMRTRLTRNNVSAQTVIPSAVLDDARQLASLENRSVSNMLSVLVAEGIHLRKRRT